MEITNLLTFNNRKELRGWLEKNHADVKCCWVACSRSKTPLPDTLPYLIIVEEALCFGWIDSTLKRLPDGRLAQRLSPRRKGSHWTNLNRSRCADLERRGLMTDAGRKALNDHITHGIIETGKLTSESVTAEVRNLYETAFPVEERIPWTHLLHLLDAIHLDFTAYYIDGHFSGLTIVYPQKGVNWLWYFAVKESSRGRGIGGRILQHLIEKCADGDIIVDIESPRQECVNALQRQRLQAFYLRNGFVDTGVGRSFNGVDYTILAKGRRRFTTRDYDNIINELRPFLDKTPKP